MSELMARVTQLQFVPRWDVEPLPMMLYLGLHVDREKDPEIACPILLDVDVERRIAVKDLALAFRKLSEALDRVVKGPTDE